MNTYLNSRVVALAPTEEEWLSLDSMSVAEPVVDVLVPVYGGYAETARCIYSLLSERQNTAFNPLIINDCSPDSRIAELLKSLARKGYIELHELPENLGFVGACNFGMSLHPSRDVLLLNSDTEVHGDWLDRLRAAAYRGCKNGSVTPFSNNATICSYPRYVEDNWAPLEISDSDLDSEFKRVNAGLDIDIPTGVGFCMYLRRDCLNEVGFFDRDSFGRGYGEENDLCKRIESRGWRNLLAADVFVRHYGSASFGAERLERVEAATLTICRLWPNYLREVEYFIARDPVKHFRRAVDVARVAKRSAGGFVLFVLHDWGGGTQSHVDDLYEILEEQGVPCLLCMAIPGSEGFIKIIDKTIKNTENLVFDVSRELTEFGEALVGLNVRHVHIHHLAGLPQGIDDFLRLACNAAQVRYDVTVHDYMSVCPRIHLVDGSGLYCGEPDAAQCDECIRINGSPFGYPSIWRWRAGYSRLFRGARKVFVPDQDVAERMSRNFREVDFVVRPHPEVSGHPGHHLIAIPSKKQVERKKRVRVGLLGALGPIKGSALLESIARFAQEDQFPIDFVVIGYTDRDSVLRSLGVEITGKYPREEAEDHLIRADVDFVWFSSVCPETYSYTLSVVLRAGLYPVAFDLGAIASRLRSLGKGKILPIELLFNVRELAENLLRIDCNFDESSGAETGKLLDETCDADDFLRSYYELLN